MAEGAGSRGAQRNKSQALAAYLKAHGIERLTGSCPWGCGRPIRNGGEHLMAHLNNCIGNPKSDRRR